MRRLAWRRVFGLALAIATVGLMAHWCAFKVESTRLLADLLELIKEQCKRATAAWQLDATGAAAGDSQAKQLA